MPKARRNPPASARGAIPANLISVRENVMPMISASCEISREYAGKPPVAKPTTRPEATIVGKLRHGRNTQGRDGPALKRMTPGASDRSQDRAQHRKADRKLLRERHALVHPESADEDRDDWVRGREGHDDRDGAKADRQEDRDSGECEQAEGREGLAHADAVPGILAGQALPREDQVDGRRH